MAFYRIRDGTVDCINVITANLTGAIADMIEQTLQQQPDMQLLCKVPSWETLETAAIADFMVQADVLVLGVEDVYSLPEDCFRLLNQYLNLKVLLLTVAGNEAIVYWRDLHCQQMQVLSSQGLFESIRQIHSLSKF
jgi:hypothetical protein